MLQQKIICLNPWKVLSLSLLLEMSWRTGLVWWRESRSLSSNSLANRTARLKEIRFLIAPLKPFGALVQSPSFTEVFCKVPACQIWIKGNENRCLICWVRSRDTSSCGQSWLSTSMELFISPVMSLALRISNSMPVRTLWCKETRLLFASP